MKSEYIVVFAPIIVITLLVFLIRRTGIKSESAVKQTEIVADTIHNTPVSFGYKVVWFAVKSSNAEEVANSLHLKNVKPSGWKKGIDSAYKDKVYVSPPIDGWVLAVGWGLPSGDSKESITELKELANKLSKQFGEVQFFGTHRIVEYHCWVKSINGEIKRFYSYLGESGENLEIIGEPTEAESNYILIDTASEEAKQESYWEREDITYPDEELVMKIAEKWSINPTTLEDRNDIRGLGLLGNYK
ncbi:hypothetical protein GCM10007424_05200 [Flavobacterium suaedae]|uniref:BRCT domain-containing protein n=1 Tax=Flavobacterium suaedae TaxID=1767027 RepID=A0ABQ1JJ92_9FLAO|nr:hypothetical protein [Flavobacterium suaedae]GGB68157.1 hypothetical protein GCM10007424_05200 [Flavobacterium suaedae]